MKTITVSVAEVEEIVFSLTAKLLKYDEPIPGFGTRFSGALEGCLVAPFQKFSGRYLYSGLIHKAAILFYLLVKNHPFKNGNKRIAMMTLLYLLFKNKKWLEVDNQVLYNFAKWVATSDPLVKEATTQAIVKFIQSHLVNL